MTSEQKKARRAVRHALLADARKSLGINTRLSGTPRQLEAHARTIVDRYFATHPEGAQK